MALSTRKFGTFFMPMSVSTYGSPLSRKYLYIMDMTTAERICGRYSITLKSPFSGTFL